jgi:hypothetical protein
MVMTKEQFKARWEKDDNGGGITFNEVAECAKSWGITKLPMTMNISVVLYRVLKEANTNDAEDFQPED